MNQSQNTFAPIVLLSTGETPFAEYLGEILCTEGLPWFRPVGSWEEAASLAGRADVLLIPHGGGADIPAVRAWLDAGGSVVAIRPPAEVCELAGLKPSDRTALELPLELEAPFDAGTARAHGEVDLFEPGGATIHARVLCNGERFPAAAGAPCGRGRLVIFAYDLPRSIALTRQGNPDWTNGRGTDFGSNTFRPADLFVRGCGAETWLDFPWAAAPLADMQQRLLAHLILSSARRPLPRIWYLPHGKTSVVTFVGDSDGADPEIVSEQFDDVAAAGGCMSVFLIDYTVDRTDAETVARWRKAGHEVSVHPDYGRHGDKSKPDRETMLLTERTILGRFRSRFGFLPRTVRNHSVSWVGFAEQPELERSLGIRLNSSYVYSSAFAKPPYGGPLVGYLNGSGRAQKFVDERGRVLDIYQLGVEVCDEMLKSQYVGADADKAWAETKKLIDASIERWHSFLVISFHPITYHSNPQAKRWLRDCILPYARDRGLPIWSAEKILDFADARRGCRIEDYEWTDGRLTCVLCPPRSDMGLTLMVPARTAGRDLARLALDGRDTPGAALRLDDDRWRLVPLEGEGVEVSAIYKYPASPGRVRLM